jgi:hypothetical protein
MVVFGLKQPMPSHDLNGYCQTHPLKPDLVTTPMAVNVVPPSAQVVAADKNTDAVSSSAEHQAKVTRPTTQEQGSGANNGRRRQTDPFLENRRSLSSHKLKHVKRWA